MSSIRPAGTRTSEWSGTTTYDEPVVLVETEYKGHKIVIRTQRQVQVFAAEKMHDNVEHRHERENSEVTVDGRYFGSKPAGTVKAAVRKIAAKLDEEAENVALLPRIQAVISNEVPPFGVTEIRVGDIVSIHSMGQFRQGIVVKIAKTRATVAYTSASNPTRIFRKADTITALRRF